MPLTEHNARYIPVEKYKAKLLANRKIEGECWLWTGGARRYKGAKSYGDIFVKELDLSLKVNRLSLLLFKPGEFRHELQVNHKCSNKLCFNPDHLYAGTQQDNMVDKVLAQTKCKYGHVFDSVNTYIRKQTGSRMCRICAKNLAAERRKYVAMSIRKH